jgi:hypothetical protein
VARALADDERFGASHDGPMRASFKVATCVATP